MYTVTINLENLGEHEDFSDAFRQFYEEVLKRVDAGQMTWQILETGCWIECVGFIDTQEAKVPVMYDDLTSLGHELGYLVEGKLVDDPPKHSAQSIFVHAQLLNINRRFLEFMSVLAARGVE